MLQPSKRSHFISVHMAPKICVQVRKRVKTHTDKRSRAPHQTRDSRRLISTPSMLSVLSRKAVDKSWVTRQNYADKNYTDIENLNNIIVTYLWVGQLQPPTRTSHLTVQSLLTGASLIKSIRLARIISSRYSWMPTQKAEDKLVSHFKPAYKDMANIMK